MPWPKAWEYAALPSIDNGALTRPIGLRAWLRPTAIALLDEVPGDEWLVWSSAQLADDDRDPIYRDTVGGADMLGDFVRLAHAPAEEILAFAQLWGILGLCR